jgi:hypothetical protein
MGTWGKGPFDEDTAMDFFDELDPLDVEMREERLKAAILRVARAQGQIEFVEGTQAVVAAALLAGMMPSPEKEPWTVSLSASLQAELASDAVIAVERAHSPGSDLWDQWSEVGGYDQVWKKLAPVLSALRAVGEAEQEGLF